MKHYGTTNRAKLDKYKRDWYARNREAAKARARRNYHANRDANRARQRARREERQFDGNKQAALVRDGH
jgi:hypothetical protein